jgi:hypothetical protein
MLLRARRVHIATTRDLDKVDRGPRYSLVRKFVLGSLLMGRGGARDLVYLGRLARLARLALWHFRRSRRRRRTEVELTTWLERGVDSPRRVFKPDCRPRKNAVGLSGRKRQRAWSIGRRGVVQAYWSFRGVMALTPDVGRSWVPPAEWEPWEGCDLGPVPGCRSGVTPAQQGAQRRAAFHGVPAPSGPLNCRALRTRLAGALLFTLPSLEAGEPEQAEPESQALELHRARASNQRADQRRYEIARLWCEL